MNKNTLLAFVLILLTVFLFSSEQPKRALYKYILKRPYPEAIQKTWQPQKPSDTLGAENRIVPASPSGASENSGKNRTGTAVAQKAVLDDTLWVETDNMIAGISESGARLISIKMKRFTYENKKNNDFIELLPQNGVGGAQVAVAGESYDTKHFTSDAPKRQSISGSETLTVRFECRNGPKQLVKSYSFANGTYRIDLRIWGTGITSQLVTVGWKGGIDESEKKRLQQSQIETRKVHVLNANDNSVQHYELHDARTDTLTGFYKWIGITSKYFFVCLVADSASEADLFITGVPTPGVSNDPRKPVKPTINYSIQAKTTAQSDTIGYWIYAGPAQYDELKKYELKFNQVLFTVLGPTKYFFWADKWFPWLAEFILWILLMLDKLVKDYGVAIVLLTILSRVVTFPLTQSSMRSMNKMKDVQPKITALRERYKNNPKKMNEEMMALYREEGVNPLNPGCLPIFLQMPVFIALFVVLRKAIELRGAGTVLIPWVHDLSQPEKILSIASIIPGGIPLYGSNIALMPVIMAILTFFQNKLTIKDPNQKAMVYIMPVFMLFLFNNFPSGLVIYWTFSSGLQLVQQLYMNRNTPAAQPAAPVVAQRKKGPSRSGRK